MCFTSGRQMSLFTLKGAASGRRPSVSGVRGQVSLFECANNNSRQLAEHTQLIYTCTHIYLYIYIHLSV